MTVHIFLHCGGDISVVGKKNQTIESVGVRGGRFCNLVGLFHLLAYFKNPTSRLNEACTIK